MSKELLIFVPGISARASGKYTERLVNNLKNYMEGQGGSVKIAGGNASAAAPDGAGGEPFTFEYSLGGPEAGTRQIALREVVWADLPIRLTELSGKDKFLEGIRLLGWVGGSLLTSPALLWANKYQALCMSGALLILVIWYLGLIITVPTAIDYSLLPDTLSASLKALLGDFADTMQTLSVDGVRIWVVTSLIMGLLPVTAVVDIAYAMKQYLREEQIKGGVGFVGEEARVRLANTLNAIRKEQAASDAPIYSGITFLAYSFGAIPTIDMLAGYRADLRAPVRLVTLGAPIAFVAALRTDFSKKVRSFIETGEAPGGIRLLGWSCIWSSLDYISSDPASITSNHHGGFVSKPLSEFSWSPNLVANHDRYVSEDAVAAVILDHGIQHISGG
jgi:hypothetical protein